MSSDMDDRNDPATFDSQYSSLQGSSGSHRHIGDVLGNRHNTAADSANNRSFLPPDVDIDEDEEDEGDDGVINSADIAAAIAAADAAAKSRKSVNKNLRKSNSVIARRHTASRRALQTATNAGGTDGIASLPTSEIVSESTARTANSVENANDNVLSGNAYTRMELRRSTRSVSSGYKGAISNHVETSEQNGDISSDDCASSMNQEPIVLQASPRRQSSKAQNRKKASGGSLMKDVLRESALFSVVSFWTFWS